jgi:tetratricopeptide (TPR) repeat protein
MVSASRKPDPTPPKTVRCYACSAGADRSALECGKCRATFLALCACGASLSVYDDRCAACGQHHVPKRLPAQRHPGVRAARWAAAAVVAGAATWIAFGERPQPAWRLLAEAADALQQRDFDAAFRAARAVTEESPGDARGWYLLAATLAQTGKFPPESYVPAAENAVRLSPGMYEARSLLALHALDSGRPEVAMEHALAAAAATGADGRAFRLLARVELAQARPDIARARDALERARRMGRNDPDAGVLLAEICLRTSGVFARGESNLDAATANVLRDALSGLEGRTSIADGAVSADAARARLHLALGDHAAAIAGAERALGALGPSAPARTRSDMELVRGMALHASGDAPGAAEDFARALRRTPDAGTAGLVAAFFEESGDLTSAEAVLTSAARAADPFGALHAVAARVQLAAGRVDAASQSIRAARAVDARNAGFAAIEAAIYVAQSKWDDARTALSEAVRLAPRYVPTRVELALFDVQRPRSAADRAAAARAALPKVEEIRSEVGDEPVVLRALGRLRLETGDTVAAAALLRSALDASPSDAETWRHYGEALLALPAAAGGAGDSSLDAARAFAQAATLKPFDAGLRMREADARIAAGDPTGAVAALDAYLRRGPATEPVLRRRAAANMQLGAWRAAANDLARLRALVPQDAGVAVGLVDALLRAHDTAAARRVAEELPGGAQSEEVRRVLEFLETAHAGRVDEACDRLASVPPTVSVAELQLGAARGDAAIETLRKVLAASPSDGRASRLLVLALLDIDPPAPERLAEARAVAAAIPANAPPGTADLVAGRIALAAGDAAGAVKHLAAAAAADPSDAFAALLLGEAQFRTGDRGESLASMRRALALPGAPASFRRIVAARVLAASIEAAGDKPRCLRLAEEAFRLSPELPQAGVHLAELHAQRGDHGRAADVVEGTLASATLTPDQRTALRFSAARCRYMNGEARRARALYEGLPAGVRESGAPRLLAGYVALQDKRLDEADAAFADVLREEPGSGAAAAGRIGVALARDDVDGARRRAEQGIASEGSRGWLLARSALLFLEAGKADDAARLAARAADVAPDDLRVTGDAAAVLAKTGRAADAIDRLSALAERAGASETGTKARLLAGRLMTRVPGREADARSLAKRIQSDGGAAPAVLREARLLEAEAMLCSGDVAGALSVARPLGDALTARDGAPSADRTFEKRLCHTLGTALSSSDGDLAEATRLLSRAYEIDPSDEVTANNLAWLLARTPATAARAHELARQATEADPRNAEFWDTRGACALAVGDYADAEASWTRARAAIDGASPMAALRRAEANLGRARALIGLDRREDAGAALRQVLADAPDSAPAAEARRLLSR